MPGAELVPSHALAAMAERVADGVWISATLKTDHKLFCCLDAQAPACSLGELATAVLSDGCPAPSLAAASKVDKSHSERNAHRLFNRYGLALRVPLSYLEVLGQVGQEPVMLPYLKMTDFLKLLLAKYELVLFGGLTLGQKTEQLCGSFWDRYRSYNADHVVYSKLSQEDRQCCIPILVHGDKGRTLQKSPIFVASFEVPWGLPPELLKRCAYDHRRNRQLHDGKLSWSCSDRLRHAGKRLYSDMSECTVASPEHLDSACDPGKSHQRHNSKGHSYLSRFLIAAVTSKMYSRNANVLSKLLETIAGQLTQLFEDGLTHKSGRKIRFGFIGVKGDAEFHWEAACFTRSYHNTGTVRENKMCPHCEAGGPGLSFVDCQDEPAWAASIAQSTPWDSTPPLNLAPFNVTRFPASLYRFDPFHVTKFGVYRDCVGSTVVRLAAMQYFDFEPGESTSVEARLSRAFSKYKLWTLGAGKNATLKKFTKANFNYEKKTKFAWVNAKGSEVTLLLMWLDFYITCLLAQPLKLAEDLVPLKAMSQMISGSLTYIGIMHSHGCFLPRCCAKLQLEAGLSFIRGYAFMAKFCTSKGVAGYRLRPKLHYMHHMLYESQQQLQAGASFILSSSIDLCEQNEDFIGRISRVSRRAAARTSSLRTTQRYLVKVRALLQRLLPD